MSVVLVVDDDMDLRNLYIELLEALGHQVFCAPDGVVALELAARLQPALILTDWRMPHMDGLALCEALRRDERFQGTRLILHSSEHVPEPWPADAFLLKPCELEVLESLVTSMLSGSAWDGSLRALA